jgi:hypothetical protein
MYIFRDGLMGKVLLITKCGNVRDLFKSWPQNLSTRTAETHRARIEVTMRNECSIKYNDGR